MFTWLFLVQGLGCSLPDLSKLSALQKPDLLEHETYDAVYRSISAGFKVKGERPGENADPQDGTVQDALSKEQMADVADGLLQQNTAPGDRDLSWMLLATACLGRSDDMRHTFLPDLCPPKPVKNIGEGLDMTDS